MAQFNRKYVVIWSNGTIAGFNSYLKLRDYLELCKSDILCKDFERIVYHIENNKIKEIEL